MDQSTQLLDGDNVVEDQSSQFLWSEKNEEILITLMEEERKNGNRKGTTFSTEGWKNLEEGMLRLTKEKYTNLQLRNKFNGLRDRYKVYKKFLSNTGSSWDSVTGQQVKHAKRFRKKGCKHYDLLSNLFGDTYATGNRAHPSNKSPCISGDEGDENPNEINEVVDTSRHRSRSPDLTRTRSTKESFQKTISSAMSGFGKYFKKKAEALDKGGGSSGMSQVDQDSAKVTECLQILEDMGPIDGDTFFKALKQFRADPLWSRVFVNLSDEKKRDWLERLQLGLD
ncbi:uncharacterized protein LOC132272947 [Cornus florida]|uniref:uncharacterized protein LOC132272947 n=1 Tax=Cornus florida TaxID=4283 RepID=UPI00289E63A0|nr:uncharacterized protein LOC132272947 [Cornus florida]